MCVLTHTSAAAAYSAAAAPARPLLTARLLPHCPATARRFERGRARATNISSGSYPIFSLAALFCGPHTSAAAAYSAAAAVCVLYLYFSYIHVCIDTFENAYVHTCVY